MQYTPTTPRPQTNSTPSAVRHLSNRPERTYAKGGFVCGGLYLTGLRVGTLGLSQHEASLEIKNEEMVVELELNTAP